MKELKTRVARVTADDEPAKLKRFIDAAKGKLLNWTGAHQVNEQLHTHYAGDDKLSTGDRVRLKKVIEQMQARGIVPATTLLTKHQQEAAARRKAGR